MANFVVKGVTSAVGTSTGSSLSVPVPSGAIDDLLIFVGGNDYNQSGQTLTVSGWTKLGQAGSSSPDCYVGVWWKLATATSESNASFTATSSAWMSATIMRLIGHDVTSPIGNSAFSTGGSSSTHTIASINTTAINSMVLAGLAFDGRDGYPFNIDTPDAMISQATNSGVGTTGCAICLGYRLVEAVGAAGSSVIRSSTSDGTSRYRVEIKKDPKLYLSDYTSKNTAPLFDTGLWDPEMINGSGVFSGVGTYQRHGNMVTVWADVKWTSLSTTGTTEIIFGELPFVVGAAAGDIPGAFYPYNGMQMNDGSSNNAYHTTLRAIGGTKTFKISSYFGTNDTLAPNSVLSWLFDNVSASGGFLMQMTYPTSDL